MVDSRALTGKVMCGYQGWFSCPEDGAELGWTHWARAIRRPFGPGNAAIDLWPDMRELSQDEQYSTQFKHADGRPATVYSSANKKRSIGIFVGCVTTASMEFFCSGSPVS